jgi:hypothetical protein
MDIIILYPPQHEIIPGGGLEIMRSKGVVLVLGVIVWAVAIPIYNCKTTEIFVHSVMTYAQEPSDLSSSPSLLSTSTSSSLSPLSTSSPLFSRHEVNTGAYDELQVFRNQSASTPSSMYLETNPGYNNTLDNSTDIQTITYFNTDGKVLNATLWLRGDVKVDPSLFGAQTVVYGVLVDSDNNQATGKYGVDFQKEIQWNSTTETWNSLLVEYSSPEHSRVLDLGSKFTSFFGENQTYVLIPLELKSITSPAHFKVLYYALVIYGNSEGPITNDLQSGPSPPQNGTNSNISKIVIDLSSWIDIPPPTYSFLMTPSPIELVKGEQHEIGLQLLSSSGTLPNSVSFVPTEDFPDIEIDEIDPGAVNQTLSGVEPKSFRIRSLNDANVGPHTVPMLVNISTGSLFPSKFIDLPGMNVSVPAESFVTRFVNLTFSIVEPPSTSEMIKEFWNTYGVPLAILASGFLGGFSTYVFDYVRNRKKSPPFHG